MSANYVVLNAPTKLESDVKEFLLDVETSPEMAYFNANSETIQLFLECDGVLSEKAKKFFGLIDLINAKVVVLESLESNPLMYNKFKQKQLDNIISDILVGFDALQELSALKMFFIAMAVSDDKIGYTYERLNLHDRLYAMSPVVGLEPKAIN